MINLHKKELEELIKAVEKKRDIPQKFVNTVEYFHSAFAYLLSLIEMKKNDRKN